MQNEIIKSYWSHIPNSLRKIFLIVIDTPDGRREVCGRTEKQAYYLAGEFYNV